MTEVSVLPQGQDPVTEERLGAVLTQTRVADASSMTALVDRVVALEANEVLENGGVTQDEIDAITGAAAASADNVFATMGDLPVADNVAAIGTTSDLTAVPASFADLAAVRTYLAGAGVLARVESRLDALEAQGDGIVAVLIAAGLMAAS